MLPDVLLVLCDTARADAFGPWGASFATPTMDGLCREGVAYSNATTQAPWTLPSTASILSGRLPTEHGINNDCLDWSGTRPTSPAEAVRSFAGPWLPELLRERGYRTWGASCNTWISSWGGFDRGFDRFLDLSDRVRLPHGRIGKFVRRASRLSGKLDRGGRACTKEFGRNLRDADSRPVFSMINLMEVHSPYDPPRPFYPYAFWKRASTFRMTGGGKGPRKFLMYNLGVENPPAEYVRTIRDLYFRCARYEDWLLGRLIGAIRERGRPTVALIVSDHGEHLGEQGLFGHNSSLSQTLLHVPLAVWGQGFDVGSGRISDPVPVTGLVGWLTRAVDGDASPMAGNGTVISEYESTTRWIPQDVQEQMSPEALAQVPPLAMQAGAAFRRGSRKYVALERDQDALYDLDADPEESRNLLVDDPGWGEEFAPMVTDWRRRRTEQPRYAAGELAEEDIADHLRALGYID